MKIKDVLTKIGAALPFVLAVTYILTSAIATRKHIEDTDHYYRQYRAAFLRINNDLNTIQRSNKASRINILASNRDTMLAELKNMRESVDYFGKIKPLGCLREEHREILSTISDERELLDALERVYRSETEEQLAENLSGIPMLNEKLFYS